MALSVGLATHPQWDEAEEIMGALHVVLHAVRQLMQPNIGLIVLLHLRNSVEVILLVRAPAHPQPLLAWQLACVFV